MNSHVTITLIQMLENNSVHYVTENDGLFLHCNVDTASCDNCISGNLCDEISFSQDVNNNFELYEYIKQTHPELLI